MRSCGALPPFGAIMPEEEKILVTFKLLIKTLTFDATVRFNIRKNCVTTVFKRTRAASTRLYKNLFFHGATARLARPYMYLMHLRSKFGRWIRSSLTETTTYQRSHRLKGHTRVLGEQSLVVNGQFGASLCIHRLNYLIAMPHQSSGSWRREQHLAQGDARRPNGSSRTALEALLLVPDAWGARARPSAR